MPPHRLRRAHIAAPLVVGVALLAAAATGCRDDGAAQPARQTSGGGATAAAEGSTTMTATAPDAPLSLPPAMTDGGMSLARAIHDRRSLREFGADPLTLPEVGQLLWSAQGVTDPRGLRAAPSGGARYPLEAHLLVGAVEGLAPGVYRYRPADHAIVAVAAGDRRAALARASGGQACVSDAPAAIVLTAVYPRITGKYGDRGRRYAVLEAGHAAQNVLLQATALGIGGVPVGAYDDEAARRALGLPAEEHVLYVLPVGRR